MGNSVKELRVLHLPLNTPYARKIRLENKIIICNNLPVNSGEIIPLEITFEWILNRSKDKEFWRNFDILHIHFGFEFESFEIVRKSLELVISKNKVIVFTCHELQSVHGTEQNLYTKYLRFIGSRADVTVTLTKAAKKVIQNEFSEECGDIRVIPHGHSVSSEHPLFGYKDRNSEEIHIAILGAFRPNRIIYSTVLNLYFTSNSKKRIITFITKPVTEKWIREDPNLLPFLNFMQSDEKLRLIMSPGYSDDELIKEMKEIDVLVLPYLSAGHSGQLALALDLGVIPLFPNVGFLQDQYEESIETILNKPPIRVVDWNDGRIFRYQFRMCKAILDICENIDNYRKMLKLSTKEWREYRKMEHDLFLEKHYDLYISCLKQKNSTTIQ